jgi:hypothetical protein
MDDWYQMIPIHESKADRSMTPFLSLLISISNNYVQGSKIGMEDIGSVSGFVDLSNYIGSMRSPLRNDVPRANTEAKRKREYCRKLTKNRLSRNPVGHCCKRRSHHRTKDFIYLRNRPLLHSAASRNIRKTKANRFITPAIFAYLHMQ